MCSKSDVAVQSISKSAGCSPAGSPADRARPERTADSIGTQETWLVLRIGQRPRCAHSVPLVFYNGAAFVFLPKSVGTYCDVRWRAGGAATQPRAATRAKARELRPGALRAIGWLGHTVFQPPLPTTCRGRWTNRTETALSAQATSH
jgi:hypothetical protein